ncbi:PREDICTED: putative B3 domain-containing protein At5g35780 [Camelina sativa]|uniref:B3 domain-containing protein At5g35780 n=1 Tax=Camelina sativa TaxID=90675 RepID=A0ABM0YXC1_CAMSA|nr:PREDICTED: putative B3 domain-containing protein At5g35780 [Camelina sativa]
MTDAFENLLAAVGIICDAKEHRRLAEKANDDSEEEVEESEKTVFRRETRVSTCLSSLLLDTAESENTENRKRKKRAVPLQSLVRSKIAKVASSPRQERETPEWLLDVMREMRGAQGPIRLIYVKPLTPSDVKPGPSRLLIPFQQLIRNDFLTHAESQAIWNGLGTILVNQRSEQWDLRIKIWVMKKKKDSLKGTLNYCLNHGWNDVVKGNRLKAGDKICLWTFRCRRVLCFALDTE